MKCNKPQTVKVLEETMRGFFFFYVLRGQYLIQMTNAHFFDPDIPLLAMYPTDMLSIGVK